MIEIEFTYRKMKSINNVFEIIFNNMIENDDFK